MGFPEGQRPPVRRNVSSLPPSGPENLSQHSQQLPDANGDKAGCLACLPDKSASRAKRAGDFVAPRDFIRNGPVGSLPDCSPGLLCRRRAKLFLENLVYTELRHVLKYSAFERHGCLQRASTPRAASREPLILIPVGRCAITVYVMDYFHSAYED